MINYKQLNQSIYNEIYLINQDHSLNIFLCGANPQKKKSLRERINKLLDADGKTNIVYPEWIFSDLLNDKDYNLLNLENELAKSVDLIVIPLEGIGTIAELGSFSSNKELLPKILILNEEKYKDEQNFINLGPLALIKDIDKDNIKYYKKKVNEEKVIEELVSKILNKRKIIDKYKLDNIFNLSRFLLFLIGIIQPVDKKQIKDYLKEWNSKIPSFYVDPAIAILLKRNLITFNTDQKKYILSPKGHSLLYVQILPKQNSMRKFSEIRLEHLNYSLRKKKKFNIKAAKEWLLASKGVQ